MQGCGVGSGCEKCFIIRLDYVPSPYSNFSFLQIEFGEKCALLNYFFFSVGYNGIICGPCMNNIKMRNSPKRDAFTHWCDGISISCMIRLTAVFMGLSCNVSIELPSSTGPIPNRSPQEPFRHNDNCKLSLFSTIKEFTWETGLIRVHFLDETLFSSVCISLNPIQMRFFRAWSVMESFGTVLCRTRIEIECFLIISWIVHVADHS